MEPAEPPPLSFERVECTINEAALSLFEQYRPELLTSTPLDLVSVVWGEKTKNFSELDTAQKEMNRLLTPVLEELKECFSQSEVDSNEISGTEYLLRGLVLYKIAYMTQYYLNCNIEGSVMLRENASSLESLEPMGEA
jgi:hypothetical protein